MTKPTKARIPKPGKKSKVPTRTIKRSPANRLALVITTEQITLLERNNATVRQESVPLTSIVVASNGVVDMPGLVNAIKLVRQKLNSKIKHVDIHYPTMLADTSMLSVPNVDVKKPEEVELAASLRVTTDLHLKPETTNHAVYPVHEQAAVAVISSDRKYLSGLIEATTAAGLSVTGLTPNAITALNGIQIDPGMSAVLNLEPNGSTLFLLQDSKLMYIERLSDLGRVIARTAGTVSQEEAFKKLESTDNWEPGGLVSEIHRNILQQANDHLSSLGAARIDQTLVMGTLSHQAAFMQALEAADPTIRAATGKHSEFADDPLLSGAVTPLSTNGWDITTLNLLTNDLKPISQRNAPNIGIILPIALTAGWVAYAVVVGLQDNALKRDESFKQDSLKELQRFAAEQQQLQSENQQMQQTLQLKNTITAKNVAWHNIIAKFTQSIPKQNGQFIATISSFTVSDAKPDVIKYGDLPVAYAYDVVANAKSRLNALDFIRHYSAAPYAIDVQRLEKKPDGTWSISATIGAKK